MKNKQPSIRKLTRWIATVVLAVWPLAANAEGRLMKIPTRPDIETTLFWHPQPNAQATVLLFPGGAGGVGKIVDGQPTGGNFLIRSVPHFLANGFNVAIFGRPSDIADLDYRNRISETHLTDIGAVLDHVKTLSRAPIWLVGTSRGTVSVTAAAIRIKNPAIAGVVLTSSIVNYSKDGAVPRQDLAAITVPVLVLHHAKDACFVCPPHQVPWILRGLRNAPVKKEVMVEGGADPAGDECGPFHWHGFIGMEEEAVNIIGNWIRNPVR